jgi:hypothetical protein
MGTFFLSPPPLKKGRESLVVALDFQEEEREKL